MIGPNLSEWAIQRRSLIVFFMIVALVAGTFSFLRLGRAEDPLVHLPHHGGLRRLARRFHRGDAQLQVTERIERKLQETRHLDRIRSYTTAGVTTIFVDLEQSTPPDVVPDIWYQVRKNIGDIRAHAARRAWSAPVSTMISATPTASSTASRPMASRIASCATTSRRSRSQLLAVPDVSKVEILGAQDEQHLPRILDRPAGWPGADATSALLAQLQAQNLVRPAGVLQTGRRTHIPARFRRVGV